MTTNIDYFRGTKAQRALYAVTEAGPDGITSREMAILVARGDVSGVNNWGGKFTDWHKAGVIAALGDEHMRENHHVYVLPEHVNGRSTWPGYYHNGSGDAKAEALTELTYRLKFEIDHLKGELTLGRISPKERVQKSGQIEGLEMALFMIGNV